MSSGNSWPQKSKTKWLNPCSFKVPLKDFNGKSWAELKEVSSTAFLWGHNWDLKWLVWSLVLGFSLFRLSSLPKSGHNLLYISFTRLHFHSHPILITCSTIREHFHWHKMKWPSDWTHIPVSPHFFFLVSVWLQWKNRRDTGRQSISFKGKTFSVLSSLRSEQITQYL